MDSSCASEAASIIEEDNDSSVRKGGGKTRGVLRRVPKGPLERAAKTGPSTGLRLRNGTPKRADQKEKTRRHASYSNAIFQPPSPIREGNKRRLGVIDIQGERGGPLANPRGNLRGSQEDGPDTTTYYTETTKRRKAKGENVCKSVGGKAPTKLFLRT